MRLKAIISLILAAMTAAPAVMAATDNKVKEVKGTYQ